MAAAELSNQEELPRIFIAAMTRRVIARTPHFPKEPMSKYPGPWIHFPLSLCFFVRGTMALMTWRNRESRLS